MSSQRSDPPLIVQSDHTVLLETGLPDSGAARDGLALFAELVKSPEHVHTYRITPLSLWNAASAGVRLEEILGLLRRYSRFDLPLALEEDLRGTLGRYGRFRLLPGPGQDLLLDVDDGQLLTQVMANPRVGPLLGRRLSSGQVLVPGGNRGLLKQVLTRLLWPVEDLAGYTPGEPLALALRDVTRSGIPFSLRPYQVEAVAAFHAGGEARGGSGVVVLPCGAGKTLVGLGILERLQTSTLVLTTSVTALRQWKVELLERTSLGDDQIGEYSGQQKQVAPVTLSTYQILTHRRSRRDPFTHFDLFRKRNWGLIVYDEVHLLPAPVFRLLADIQARRRLGLTATLVREDGREEDVFSLIGPKKYDAPWRDLERQGFIAAASCIEVRVPMASALRRTYYAAEDRRAFRLASTNPAKDRVVERILRRHPGEGVLVIGHYLDQLRRLAADLGAPLVMGSTPQGERDRLYEEFRAGRLPVLVVSRVANFAVDLPSASVAVQVSGTFGSRQEEAQRLGRILRPKETDNTAHFYTLVSWETVEVEFARRRQIFLAEQGYRYLIENAVNSGG
ncbi:MAG: DNA repair helicase XPB [Acidobacteriota bacterium]